MLETSIVLNEITCKQVEEGWKAQILPRPRWRALDLKMAHHYLQRMIVPSNFSTQPLLFSLDPCTPIIIKQHYLNLLLTHPFLRFEQAALKVPTELFQHRANSLEFLC